MFRALKTMKAFLEKEKPVSFTLGFELIHLFLFLFILFSVSSAALVQMRVVKDTANYGYFGNNLGELENNIQLIARAAPANFTGPELLKRLAGKCYNLTEDRYRYLFCPYQNMTQYELSGRWNAYHGILGIWSHWNIENNTFASMIYSHGDACGDVDRSVTVHLKCGSAEALSNVTEPKKCQYDAIFSTRYVCHRDALLVYPRLRLELRKEWDRLLTSYHYRDLTEKGYQEGLKKIFQNAGLVEVTPIKPHKSSTAASLLEMNTFNDLFSCNKEYKNLQNEISQLHEEIESLKLLIDINKMQNRTSKTQKMSRSFQSKKTIKKTGYKIKYH